MPVSTAAKYGTFAAGDTKIYAAVTNKAASNIIVGRLIARSAMAPLMECLKWAKFSSSSRTQNSHPKLEACQSRFISPDRAECIDRVLDSAAREIGERSELDDVVYIPLI